MNKQLSTLQDNFESLSLIEKISCLFPFFAILGSPFINLYYIIIIFFGFRFYITKGKFSIKKFSVNKTFVFFFIIPYCLILLSFLNSDYQNTPSMIRSLLSFKFLILPFIFYYLIKNNNFFKLIGINTIVVLIFLGLDIIFQFIIGHDFFGIVSKTPNRYSGFLGDEYIAGSFISLFFIYVFLFLNLFLNSYKKNFLILVVSIFFLCVIIITGERLALLRYLFFLSFLILLYIPSLKRKIFSLVTVLLILVNFLIFNESFKVRFYEALFFIGLSDQITQLNKNYDNLKYINTLSNAPWVSHWKASYLIYKDNKFTGVGLKNFRLACKNEKYHVENILDRESLSSCTTHPHNVYMEVLSELGTTGFIYFLFIIIFFYRYLLKSFLRNLVKKKNKYIFSSILIFSTVPFLPSGSIFSSNFGGILFFIISTFVVFNKINAKKN